MFNLVTARAAIFLLCFTCAVNAIAQPILPDLAGSSEKGLNIIGWNCQYDGIKSIAVQRSSDSIYNYVTLGYVRNLKKGPQAYIDGHPLPGKNWYRLYIVFNSDLTWYSNRLKLVVDSSFIKNSRVMPPNDSLQKLTENIVMQNMNNSSLQPEANNTPTAPSKKIVLNIKEDTDEDGISYIKSQYVYTNPFTGHVNIDIPEYKQHSYSINFFNEKDQKVLEIGRVIAEQLIIDKRNFQKKGIFKFELRQDRKVLETGFITIY